MQKDNEIRTLRAQQKQKEMILKRKQEEVRRFRRPSSFSQLLLLFQVHLLRRQMRSARVRKTTKEMTEHFAAIQQGVRHRKIVDGTFDIKFAFSDFQCNSSSKIDRWCQSRYEYIDRKS